MQTFFFHRLQGGAAKSMNKSYGLNQLLNKPSEIRDEKKNKSEMELPFTGSSHLIIWKDALTCSSHVQANMPRLVILMGPPLPTMVSSRAQCLLRQAPSFTDTNETSLCWLWYKCSTSSTLTHPHRCPSHHLSLQGDSITIARKPPSTGNCMSDTLQHLHRLQHWWAILRWNDILQHSQRLQHWWAILL